MPRSHSLWITEAGSSLDLLSLKPACLSNITPSVFRAHAFHLSSTLSVRERKDKHIQSCRWLREKKKLVQVPTGGNVDGETELDILETFSSSSPTRENLEDIRKITMYTWMRINLVESVSCNRSCSVGALILSENVQASICPSPVLIYLNAVLKN